MVHGLRSALILFAGPGTRSRVQYTLLGMTGPSTSKLRETGIGRGISPRTTAMPIRVTASSVDTPNETFHVLTSEGGNSLRLPLVEEHERAFSSLLAPPMGYGVRIKGLAI